MRILDITTDSVLFRCGPAVRLDHLPYGRSVLPSGRSKDAPGASLAALGKALLAARFGAYDWLVLPPCHVGWTVANSRKNIAIKKIVAWFAARPCLSRMFRWLLLGKTPVALLDNSDQLMPSAAAVALFDPEVYLMLNPPRELLDRPLPHGRGRSVLRRIPMLMDDEAIDRLDPGPGDGDRAYDVFITGIYHNPQREKQLAAAHILSARGYRVNELTERGFEKFSAGLGSAKLCFAGRGLGYYAIRMYEAASAGAVPVVHDPEEGTAPGFRSGENAIVYSPDATPEQIADAVEAALRDPGMIARARAGAKNLVDTENRGSALAARVLECFQTGRTIVGTDQTPR